MNVKLLTKQHFEFLSVTEGCTGSSESTHVKMPRLISLNENVCSSYPSYSLMLLFNGYVGHADSIKKLFDF